MCEEAQSGESSRSGSGLVQRNGSVPPSRRPLLVMESVFFTLSIYSMSFSSSPFFPSFLCFYFFSCPFIFLGRFCARIPGTLCASQSQRLPYLESKLRRLRVDIVGLSETGRPGCGEAISGRLYLLLVRHRRWCSS